jgi:hypothetical protein
MRSKVYDSAMIREALRSTLVVLCIAAVASGCAQTGKAPDMAAQANVACHDDVFLSSSGQTIATVPHCESVAAGNDRR